MAGGWEGGVGLGDGGVTCKGKVSGRPWWVESILSRYTMGSISHLQLNAGRH